MFLHNCWRERGGGGGLITSLCKYCLIIQTKQKTKQKKTNQTSKTKQSHSFGKSTINRDKQFCFVLDLPFYLCNINPYHATTST